MWSFYNHPLLGVNRRQGGQFEKLVILKSPSLSCQVNAVEKKVEHFPLKCTGVDVQKWKYSKQAHIKLLFCYRDTTGKQTVGCRLLFIVTVVCV